MPLDSDGTQRGSSADYLSGQEGLWQKMAFQISRSQRGFSVKDDAYHLVLGLETHQELVNGGGVA